MVPGFGDVEDLYDLLELAEETLNPGLVYYNNQYKGFFAVRVTKDSHVAENYVVTRDTTLAPYPADESTAESRTSLTVPYFCDAQLTTTAGERGSLERSNNCSAITFDETRPAAWDIPYPLSAGSSMSDLSVQLSNCGYDQCRFQVPEQVPMPSPSSPTEAGKPDASTSIPSFAKPVMVLAILRFAQIFHFSVS
jgi:hypothetical protein